MRARHRRRRQWTLGVAAWLGLGLALAIAGVALAAWVVIATSGSNYAEATAQTLPTGATPTATVSPVSGQTVTITFAQTSTSGGVPVTSYVVSRYAVGSSSGTTVSGSCLVTAGVVTCTDSPSSGSWQYTDTATIASSTWLGTPSAKSTTVVVQALSTTSMSVTASSVVQVGVTPSAILAGTTTSPAPGGSIAFSVFGPQATAPSSCSGTGWSGVGSSVTVTAAGTYNASTSFTPTAAGTYWWEAVYSGDTNNAGSSTSCSVNSTVVHLALSPTTLPAATVYAAYSQAITPASGGTAPYTYAVTSGTLPTGLSLSSSGTLSGTISAAGQSGSFSFTITATDHVGLTGSASYSLTVNNPTISLSTLANPVGESTDTASVSASGGQASYTYAVTSGNLPTGLSLSSSGAFSGAPSAAGSFAFTITATDANGYAGAQSYTLTPTSPTFSLSTLANPVGESTDTASVSASGGVGSYTYAVTSGTLPTGLSLSSSGAFSGAPSVAGSFTFTITATDADGFTGSRSYTLTPTSPTISLSTLANPVGESTDTASVTASGGVGSYTYAVTSGTLPTGLSLSSSGAFSGAPSAAGSFTFTITATDHDGFTGAHSYTLTPTNPTFTFTPTSPLTDAIATIAYSQALSTSGGVGPYTYTVTSGSLPTGLTLTRSGTSAGTLSGTPAAVSASTVYSFTVTATDADGFTGTNTYSLTVVPMLTGTSLGSGSCSLISLGGCSTTISTTTSNATELVLIYSTGLVNPTVSSVTGPFNSSAGTGKAALVTSTSFSSDNDLYAYIATGNGSSGTVSANISVSLLSTTVVDVVQLAGNNPTSGTAGVAQSIAGSGTSSPVKSTFGAAPALFDGEVVFATSPSSITLTPTGTPTQTIPVSVSGLTFDVYIFDPAATSQSFNFTGSSADWGSIGMEFVHN